MFNIYFFADHQLEISEIENVIKANIMDITSLERGVVNTCNIPTFHS